MTLSPASNRTGTATWNTKSADTAVQTPRVAWFKWTVDCVNDTASEGIFIGNARYVEIHIGTVTTPIATNNLVFELQAGTPDGTWNDMGNTLTLLPGTSTIDVVSLARPPQLLRLDFTGTAPTAGALTIFACVVR